MCVGRCDCTGMRFWCVYVLAKCLSLPVVGWITPTTTVTLERLVSGGKSRWPYTLSQNHTGPAFAVYLWGSAIVGLVTGTLG